MPRPARSWGQDAAIGAASRTAIRAPASASNRSGLLGELVLRRVGVQTPLWRSTWKHSSGRSVTFSIWPGWPREPGGLVHAERAQGCFEPAVAAAVRRYSLPGKFLNPKPRCVLAECGVSSTSPAGTAPVSAMEHLLWRITKWRRIPESVTPLSIFRTPHEIAHYCRHHGRCCGHRP